MTYAGWEKWLMGIKRIYWEYNLFSMKKYINGYVLNLVMFDGMDSLVEVVLCPRGSVCLPLVNSWHLLQPLQIENDN